MESCARRDSICSSAVFRSIFISSCLDVNTTFCLSRVSCIAARSTCADVRADAVRCDSRLASETALTNVDFSCANDASIAAASCDHQVAFFTAFSAFILSFDNAISFAVTISRKRLFSSVKRDISGIVESSCRERSSIRSSASLNSVSTLLACLVTLSICLSLSVNWA